MKYIISGIVVPIVCVFLASFFVIRENRKNKLFEYEIEAYKNLALKLDFAVYDAFMLFPYGPILGDISDKEKLFDRSQKSLSEFQNELLADEIFVGKELYSKNSEVKNLIISLLYDFCYINSEDSSISHEERGKINQECVNKNKKIKQMKEEIKSELQRYIKKLK